MSKKSCSPLEVVRQRRTLALSGLTLVEVVVAMVILVSVIAGLLATFTAGKRFALHAKYRLVAANIARAVLEDLKDDVRQDTWDIGELRVQGWQELRQVEIEPIDYRPRYRVESMGNPEPGYRKVTVEVRWTPPG